MKPLNVCTYLQFICIDNIHCTMYIDTYQGRIVPDIRPLKLFLGKALKETTIYFQALYWQDYLIVHCPALELFFLSTHMETILLSSSIAILLSNPIEKSAVVPALELFIFLVLILFLFWTVFTKDHLKGRKKSSLLRFIAIFFWSKFTLAFFEGQTRRSAFLASRIRPKLSFPLHTLWSFSLF